MPTIHEIFDNKIEESKTIIKEDNEKELLPLSLVIQDFLISENILIDKYFKEEEYYQLVGYPNDNFIDLTIKVKTQLVEKLNEINPSDYYVDNYINGYITILKYRGITMLKLINIFYPVTSNKFQILGYEDKSRYNSDKVLYIHPKYNLENILSKLHNPYYEAGELEVENLYKFLNEWKKFKYNTDFIYKRANRLGREILQKIKGKFIFCNIDFFTSNIIMSRGDLEFLFNSIPPEYETNEYKPFTMEDIRIKIIEITKDKKLQVKVWVMSDFELIPVIGLKTHIYINMRLLILENIIQEILGNVKFANIKLMIFNYYFNRYKNLKRNNKLKKIEECDFIGTNHDIDSYLKQKRLDDKVKYYKRKQRLAN